MALSVSWIDYYKLMGVVKSASEQQIRSAYRKLALKIHPDKNKAADATEKFKELGKAYETLSTKDLKAVYDISYESKTNTQPIREYAFFYPNFDAKFASQDPAVFHDVFVTLWEIFRGCTKKVTICRSFKKDGKVIQSENKSFDVNIIPGCKNQSTITHSRAGDRHPFRIPADLVFVIKDFPHPNYSRYTDGNHLKYSGTFTIEQAMFDSEIEVQQLCGTALKVALTDADVQEVFRKEFKGLGLPDCRNPSNRGDLITEFRVQIDKKAESVNIKALLDEIRKFRKRISLKRAESFIPSYLFAFKFPQASLPQVVKNSAENSNSNDLEVDIITRILLSCIWRRLHRRQQI